MKKEQFQKLLDELDGNSLQTLKEKNARYSQNGDCLHNFRSGAELTGRTPAQTCWGYMSKHLTALRDMVEKDDFSDREDFLEKCQDIINYIRFLWCIGNDTRSKYTSNNIPNINADKSYKRCIDVFSRFNKKDPYKQYVGGKELSFNLDSDSDRVTVSYPGPDKKIEKTYDLDTFFIIVREGYMNEKQQVYTFGK